jgi:hypothetical protein
LITKEKIVKPFFKTEVNAYNLYSVSKSDRHYLWCLPVAEQGSNSVLMHRNKPLCNGGANE